MVVTFLPATSESAVWHERTALPSRCTVQAPHNPDPHPNLVPVTLRCPRPPHSRGVSDCASTLAALPLIVNATAMRPSCSQRFPPDRLSLWFVVVRCLRSPPSVAAFRAPLLGEQ